MHRALAVVGLFLIAGRVAAQPPVISSATPLGLRPGVAVDLTLRGERLASPVGLWASIPATAELAAGVAKNGTAADHVVYRVGVAAETPVGIVAVRVVTGQGVSSLKPLLVDDLPSAADGGQNHTLATAQAIGSLVAVDGACESVQSDFYKLTAKAGETVSIEVVAQRLGSLLDGLLRITDAAGKEIAFSDDDAGGDPRLRHTFAADGEYFIELRDVRHQGGGGHFYRLRVGDFPLVTAAYPLAVQVGMVTNVIAARPDVANMEGAKLWPVEVNVLPDAAIGARAVAFRYPGGKSSGFASVDVVAAAQTSEVEPNATAAEAAKVVVPGGVNGRFDGPGDRDTFSFTANKGQRLRFVGNTRTHGSPSDLLLRVTKADGGGLAEADDAGGGEAELSVTIPEDGVYHLVAEDLHRRGGGEYVYRVDVAPFQAGFALSIENEKLDVPQEGSVLVKVTSARRDYNGPIALAVEGLGDGVVLEGQTIDKGKNETQLRITLPPGVGAGKLAQAKIVGRAKIGEQEFAATAGTLAALRKLMPGATYPARNLEGLLAVGVGPVYPPFFEISVDGGRVEYPRLVGAASFKVKLKRIDGGFKAPIALAVENLPAGVTAEVKPVGKGEAEYDVLLKGPDELPGGALALRLIGTGTHNNQTKRAVIDAAPIAVVQPVSLSLSAGETIAIVRGGTAKVKVTAKRLGERSAIQLNWLLLPAGVVGPQGAMLTAEQNEAEFTFTAAADGVLGDFQVAVAGTTKVKGQEVAIESGAAAMVVKAP